MPADYFTRMWMTKRAADKKLADGFASEDDKPATKVSRYEESYVPHGTISQSHKSNFDRGDLDDNEELDINEVNCILGNNISTHIK